MRKIDFKVAVWQEGKYYISQCLNLDISSYGRTKKESLSNLQEALELYLEDVDSPKLTKVKKPDVVSLKMQYA